jgi:ribosomal-protein-alanine N-acetyltransferase
VAKSLITTRLFEEQDLSAVYAMEEACFAPPLRFSRALLRSLVFSAECRTWMGLADGVVCGFAIVSLIAEDDPDDDEDSLEDADSGAAYLWTIEVLEAYRGKGVARMLLKRAEENARESGKSKMVLHVSERNAAAIALYEGCGYERVGFAPAMYGAHENGFRYDKAL